MGGFNAPRRMSERDLPSKILREQNHDLAADHPISGNQFSHGGHPLMMQGRIHSSKSVPSLNSDIPNVVGGGMQHSGNNSGAAPMVRSPAHHHHGNNVGGSHGQHIQSQNHINESPNGPRYPHGYPTMSMTMQHGSKSSMMSGGGGHIDAQTAAMRSRSIQSLADPPHRPDIGNKQPSTPALHMQQSEDTERFYQNVGFYPPPPPPPTNPANMPVRTYIPYSNSTGNISSQAAFRSPSGGGSHISPHYPGYPGVRAPPPNLNASVPSNLNWQQRMNATAHHPQHQQNHGVSRDLLRQEAKMLEMQDELRRREERAALMMSKQQQQQQQQNNTQRYSQSQNQLGYPGGHPAAQQRPVSGTGPPAPAPKPYNREAEVAPGRPPLPEEFKHPVQFSASMTEIPKGAFSYNNGVVTKPATLGGSAWAREEKENEAKRRKEAAKYWRDQQIHELDIVHHRTPVQDEQLRALKLEREFQRRAEEMQRNDEEGNDDEDDEEDDRKAMVRRLQEDLERTRISANGNSKLDPMEEERARKIEEMRRKKLELEAAHAAEERLVREAAKRRPLTKKYDVSV
ncbi:Afadin [Orchesella cincta]|uniref:Afadin n=1 Tax=Orchesella cincta TaxID=48709 RepID=A0A1D2NM63_ORCCI|nr:Afadin [Orchesella cincta]